MNGLPDFCKSVPYQIKSIAIKDACKAVNNAKKKFKNGESSPVGGFPSVGNWRTRKGGGISKVKFRSRKDPIQSCYIPKSAVSDKGIYYTVLGEARFKETLPQSFGDCRLVKAYGDYYLTVPMVVSRQQPENQGRVVALDPGIRTFITFFSESSFG
ncbi:hypothetical protein H6G83_25285, partial [Anabaena azotica FACHB-119]|nr:hypothetical protein [Anabaena azotica FACHB-119]